MGNFKVPGSTKSAELAMLYRDVATLAFRLNKPLACRVWPVPGAEPGAVVEFGSPFFVDSAVLPLSGR